uniref:Uncharacterized protein n=1 Tax=Cacopsylla melanoneura TaxID=428564 RepID=A0A8D9E8D9_9HEMI
MPHSTINSTQRSEMPRVLSNTNTTSISLVVLKRKVIITAKTTRKTLTVPALKRGDQNTTLKNHTKAVRAKKRRRKRTRVGKGITTRMKEAARNKERKRRRNIVWKKKHTRN